MNIVPVLNFKDFIAADGDALVTTSAQIAAAFAKPHYRVLRAIRKLLDELPVEEHAANFGVTQVEVHMATGGVRLDPAFKVTKDGFALLAMGFTGKKALGFKVAYIKAFNAMAAYIKNEREGLRYRCMEKELECRDSERRGSFHGKGLNQRKQEKPVLETELAALHGLVQPTLLN